MSSSQPIICVPSELPEFFAELTELAAELSEFFLPKRYSRNSIPTVSQNVIVDFFCIAQAPSTCISLTLHNLFSNLFRINFRMTEKGG